MLNRTSFYLFILVVVLQCSSFINTNEITWLGGTGNFSDPNSWNEGTVPGYLDTAFINFNGSIVESPQYNINVTSIQLGNVVELDINNSEVIISSSLICSYESTVNVQASTLTINQIQISGILTLNSTFIQESQLIFSLDSIFNSTDSLSISNSTLSFNDNTLSYLVNDVLLNNNIIELSNTSKIVIQNGDLNKKIVLSGTTLGLNGTSSILLSDNGYYGSFIGNNITLRGQSQIYLENNILFSDSNIYLYDESIFNIKSTSNWTLINNSFNINNNSSISFSNVNKDTDIESQFLLNDNSLLEINQSSFTLTNIQGTSQTSTHIESSQIKISNNTILGSLKIVDSEVEITGSDSISCSNLYVDDNSTFILGPNTKLSNVSISTDQSILIEFGLDSLVVNRTFITFTGDMTLMLSQFYLFSSNVVFNGTSVNSSSVTLIDTNSAIINYASFIQMNHINFGMQSIGSFINMGSFTTDIGVKTVLNVVFVNQGSLVIPYDTLLNQLNNNGSVEINFPLEILNEFSGAINATTIINNTTLTLYQSVNLYSGLITLNGNSAAIISANNFNLSNSVTLNGNGLVNANVYNSATIGSLTNYTFITFEKDFTQMSEGTIYLNIDGDNMNHSSIIFKGKATFDGTLIINIQNSPKMDYSKPIQNIIQANIISGNFSSVKIILDPTITIPSSNSSQHSCIVTSSTGVSVSLVCQDENSTTKSLRSSEKVAIAFSILALFILIVIVGVLIFRKQKSKHSKMIRNDSKDKLLEKN